MNIIWNGIDNREPINPKLVEKLEERWEPPKVFENAISPDEIAYLLKMEQEANDVKKMNVGGYQRRIVNDRSKAFEFLKSKIDSVCTYPYKFSNELGTGNFFRTRSPYTLHADTGVDPNTKLYRIVVFPLEISVTPGKEYLEQYNRFTIMNQRWYGQAAIFIKNDYEELKKHEGKYIRAVTEYTHMTNIDKNYVSKERVNDLYSHLKPEYFEEMSENACVRWQPGDIMTFNRCDIHTATNFFKANVFEKTAVTFFLEYADL